MSKGPLEPTLRARLDARPLGEGDRARITGGHLARRQEVNRSVSLPSAIEQMEASGTLDNFRAAAGRSRSPYVEPVFRDSDLYKVLEALAWDRQHGAVAEHDVFFAESAELLKAAQQEDGYLDTFYQVAEPGGRMTNPAMGHELYCAGHLVQATVAALRSGLSGTGIGEVAGRLVDWALCELGGPAREFVPGHPEIETALVEYAREVGRPELVELARDLICRRGRNRLTWRSFPPSYFQDDIPFVQAKTIRGHAVRALYLLCGAADVAAETGDRALLDSALAQWDDLTRCKTFLTGGVGSRHRDESFGDPYELPPDQAYCETCAAIASAMLNWRLLLATGEGRFADLLERTLYNAVLAGAGLDGRTYFYDNPLHARTPTARNPWFRVACCPPNLMRLFASLEHYLVSVAGASVRVHLYATGSIEVQRADGAFALEIETDYPNTGEVLLRVRRARGLPFDLALRVPGWAASAAVAVNGVDRPLEVRPDGYLHLWRAWQVGDEVVLSLPMPVRVLEGDPALDAVRGTLAFERGPLVYCVEGVDVPKGAAVGELFVPRDVVPTAAASAEIAGASVVPLELRALWRRSPLPAWPFLERGFPPLEMVPITVRAVPYWAWANRGPAEMRVFLPAAP